MSFKGMDPDAVEALAGKLEAQANLINGIVNTVDSTVSALAGVWFGDDFGHFQSGWNGHQRGQAKAAVADVQHAITKLRTEIAEQRQTSDMPSGGIGALIGVGGIAATIGGLVGGNAGTSEPNWIQKLWRREIESKWLGFHIDDWSIPGLVIYGAGKALLPAGAIVDSIIHGKSIFQPRSPLGRWLSVEKGFPKSAGQFFDRLAKAPHDANWKALAQQASKLEKFDKAAKVLGPVGAVLDGASAGWSEWQNDAKLPSDERITNTAVVSTTTAAGSLGGAIVGGEAGAAIGTAIFPGVGTVVGGAVGGIVGGFAGSEAGQWVGGELKGAATGAVHAVESLFSW